MMIIELPPNFLINAPLDTSFIDDEKNSSSNDSSLISFSYPQINIIENDDNIIGSFKENIELKQEI